MRERKSIEPGQPGRAGQALTDVAELPVVARLVVEVRSDGTRTVARGAMEDAATGLRAAIDASGNTPLELAMALAKSVVSAPWFVKQVTRSSLRGLLKRR